MIFSSKLIFDFAPNYKFLKLFYFCLPKIKMGKEPHLDKTLSPIGESYPKDQLSTWKNLSSLNITPYFIKPKWDRIIPYSLNSTLNKNINYRTPSKTQSINQKTDLINGRTSVTKFGPDPLVQSARILKLERGFCFCFCFCFCFLIPCVKWEVATITNAHITNLNQSL